MRSYRPRPRAPRRGVTLVEMLVTVALLVLMMTIIVQVFQAATGAVSGAQAYQELDGHLRRLDTLLRQDLSGVTAKMTPPNDPNKNTGYFEYGENAFADLQGEDSDDYLRFTAKAPEGQYFTGRFWLSINNNQPAPMAAPAPNQPILTTSQFAEIIYFVRNGNLYRRVLLVAPEKQTALNAVTPYPSYFPDFLGGSSSSWLGVNDFSAHPSPHGAATIPVLNTLGHLTNRENRWPSPRFADDFAINSTGAAVSYGDGIADDENAIPGPMMSTLYVGDGVHDYYPTLYPGLFSGTASPNLLVWEHNAPARYTTYDVLAFPFIYPGAYSKPEPYTGLYGGGALALGWIHSLDPATSSASYLIQLQRLNHAPLDVGDSLPLPGSGSTWWGFPTWKETMSPKWNDPTLPVQFKGGAPAQPRFLYPISPAATPTFTANNVLPPMTYGYRNKEQPYNDGVGTTPLSGIVDTASNGTLSWAAWPYVWEDDLILTGVRSFDVKAYDTAFQGYVDLGWGDDLRLQQPFGVNVTAATPGFLDNTPLTFFWPPAAGTTWDTLGQTFAHEGRIPPLHADNRLDPHLVQLTGISQANPGLFPGYAYDGNVGDNQASVIRLRRVWDSWSTAYTNAPSNGTDPLTKMPVGPPFGPPVYPSYPPPYPAPLRGIQIQVRVTDPQNQRVKVLTIRQDFTDKL